MNKLSPSNAKTEFASAIILSEMAAPAGRVLPEFDSADEPMRKVMPEGVPPSRALLVAEVPFSGRARARKGGKITALPIL